jgi:sulfatase modifying factor 1
VTNAQYELYDPAHESERWGWPGEPQPHPAAEEAKNHPVVNVTWFQAWSFAQWTGNHLPTEAQWEYSVREGGTSSTPFHYGTSLSEKEANFDSRDPYGVAEASSSYLEKTTSVGSYQPNKLGLFDMHGNVWEWCQDWYGSYCEEEITDPQGPLETSARVLRGGSWFNRGGRCRSAFRSGSEPVKRYHFYGFRLAAVPCIVGAQLEMQ